MISINADGHSPTNEEINIGVDNYNTYSDYYPIVEGKYIDTAFRFEVELIYRPDGSITNHYDGGNNFDGWGAGNPPTSNHLQVTVTTLNDTAFIGTFTGNIYPGGIITKPPMTITDGTFNVKFTK